MFSKRNAILADIAVTAIAALGTGAAIAVGRPARRVVGRRGQPREFRRARVLLVPVDDDRMLAGSVAADVPG